MLTGFWWENQKEKKPLSTLRCSWEDNDEIHVGVRGWGDLSLIDLSEVGDQCRDFVSTVMNRRLLKNVGKL
jgi:hypothetical protein